MLQKEGQEKYLPVTWLSFTPAQLDGLEGKFFIRPEYPVPFCLGVPRNTPHIKSLQQNEGVEPSQGGGRNCFSKSPFLSFPAFLVQSTNASLMALEAEHTHYFLHNQGT